MIVSLKFDAGNLLISKELSAPVKEAKKTQRSKQVKIRFRKGTSFR